MLVLQNSVLNAGILLALFCHFKIHQLSQSNYLLLYQLIFTVLSIINHNSSYDIPYCVIILGGAEPTQGAVITHN